MDVLNSDLEAVEAPSLGHLERTQVVNQSSTMTRLDRKEVKNPFPHNANTIKLNVILLIFHTLLKRHMDLVGPQKLKLATQRHIKFEGACLLVIKKPTWLTDFTA